jgi:16S rRNA (uracil1498-N3)-methyltransferase
MRLTRVHIDQPLHEGARVTLPESAGAHLVRVLRLREGEACVLFNGDGHDYDARLLAVTKRNVEADIIGVRAIDNESPLRIVLMQGIARGEKMDLILQKATELGVVAIAPVFADRTEVRLDGERLDKRIAHWRSVVIAACEQSGRARIPELLPARGLAEAAATLNADSLKLTLDPQGDDRFDTLASPQKSSLQGSEIVIGIGPEGGWSDKDRMILRTHGFRGLRLGPRVLRTETAGLAAIAALQAKFGDL